MVKKLLNHFFLSLTCLALHVIYCNGQAPVSWKFEQGPVKDHQFTLFVTASLAPGWHLYSQSLKEGGPMPTRFTFDAGDDYRLAGPTEETGIAKKFIDDTYEMEIIWYTGVVSFRQKVILNEANAAIKGKVEYMTCNNEVCIPAEEVFRIEVRR
jgi:hypothetical protein